VAHQDWLQTPAEVAVALAGLSGLLAGIRQGSQRESQINVTRLRTIVETSLSVLAFCLIPVFLNGLGISEIGAFRISAITFLAAFIPVTALGFRRFRLAVGASAIQVISRPLGGATVLVSGVALVAGGACAAAFPASAVPTLYLMALRAPLRSERSTSWASRLLTRPSTRTTRQPPGKSVAVPQRPVARMRHYPADPLPRRLRGTAYDLQRSDRLGRLSQMWSTRFIARRKRHRVLSGHGLAIHS
jgi:hypothetical protein